MKNFSQWLNEMATLNFGGAKGHKGRDHTEVPTHYLQWMKDKIDGGEANFDLRDKGTRLNPVQVKDLISGELNKRGGGYTPQASQQSIQPQQTQPQKLSPQNNQSWIWAKSLIAAPEYNIPAANLDMAVKQKDTNNWTFVIVDVEDRRLVNYGNIPNDQIRTLIKSQRDANNQLVRVNRPSDLINVISPKKSGLKKTIPDEQITQEQKAIEEKFSHMMQSGGDHMIISALAGSGKTTVLKHLAWKFSAGKKWLYLVFNTKNKEEAKEEFPPNVQVETTNSWAGRELLGKNVLKPTDRIQDYSHSEKSRLIVDSATFKHQLKSIGIPQQELLYGNDPKGLGRTERTLWYTLRSINSEFKSEVLKIVGLSKSFAIDPRNESELESKINDVMSKYDLNTNLEDIKERIEKNNPWAKREINNLFGYDFMGHNFKEEMIKSAKWLLVELMPHNTQEEYTADTGKNKGKSVNLGTTRDFDDDLWFAAMHADELTWPKYDVVLADEVQDFNVAQQIILKNLAKAGAKIVAVGDKHQCHPGETLISMTGGTTKTIKDIEIGDEVVTYNTKKSYFPGTNTQGRKVLEKAERLFKGEFVIINTENNKLKCTPNHKCLVKFDNAGRDKFAVYVMIKNNNARIGMCRLNYKNGFGLAIRATQEEADRSYLLEVFETEREARISEIVNSCKFNIPQLMFKNNGYCSSEQTFINEVYEKIGNNIENAKKCVESFGRIWEYPIWSKEKKEKFGKISQNYIGSRKSFITQACNLISNYMLVRTFDGTNRGGKWSKIFIEKEKVETTVYSLRVEPTEDNRRLYIANNIVVSNSIYRFRGADSNAFDQLKSMLGSISSNPDVERTLNANFRSRQNIIDFANEHGDQNNHVKNLVKGRNFKEEPGKLGKGEVSSYDLKYDDVFDKLKQEHDNMGEIKQTAFLSRTNEPLVHASLKLMKMGIPFVILGKDIANDLTKHIDKIANLYHLNNDSSVSELLANMNSYHLEQKEKHDGKAAMHGRLKELKETTEAMTSSIEQFIEEHHDGSIFDLRKWLRDKFGGVELDKSGREGEIARKEYKRKLEELNPVILTTVHKSKGLQFQRVYILRDDLWPHPRAERPEDKEQELNNKYIAMTRAEDELHILDTKGQPGVPER